MMSVSYMFPSDEPLFREIDVVLPIAELIERPTKPKRNTKAIGDISEAMVIAALVRSGFLVSIPFGENHRYDLIADDGERLLRVQVKTGRLRDGAISFACCSSHQHRRSGPTASRPYFGQIEYLAVYCPTNRKVYLVPESELVATYGHLRVEPTRNGQVRNIRWACEYELA